MSGEAASVYLHAPFCQRRCFYCDFAVEVRGSGETDAWLEALARELALLEASGAALASRLETVFVGGGTPSLLGPSAMAGLREVLGPARLGGDSLEWTAEANPESVDAELISAWAEAGVNRISIGVQSFQEPVLRWMGRLHGAAGAVAAVEAIRTAGIENLSFDLIFGLPDSVERSWRRDLETALELDPPHISLYGLTAESGTPLGRRVSEGTIRMPADERYREEYLLAHELLTDAGYVHYEVSNFARPGRESRHNRRYWDGSPYLGLGNSSHSFLPPERRWNLRGWADYLDSLARGKLPVEGSERVEGESAGLERSWLGLRTDGGVSLNGLQGARARALVARWEESGWARPAHGRLRLTPEGWLLLDELAVELAGVVSTPAIRVDGLEAGL